MPRSARAAPAFLQSLMQVRARGLQSGREAEERASNNGDGQCEKKDTEIDAHIVRPWQCLWQSAQPRLRSPASEKHAQSRAGNRQQQTFRQQLPDNTAPGRTEN